MKLYSFLLAAALACLTVSLASAAKLGDPAAPLVIKEWIKGKPVDVKDGKNIYVIEFWATWCAPCKVSIPHLTEMQKSFKDKGVVFVGISDEPPSKVNPFVKTMGANMDYTVACDDDRQSNENYMQAFGQDGIPHAFVIGKDGKVIWHGHPLDKMHEALEQMLNGTYDVKAAMKADEARSDKDDYQMLAMKGDPKAKEFGLKLLAKAGNDVQALTDLAFSIVSNTHNTNRDFALAGEVLDKAQKLAGANDHRVLGVRSVLLFETGQKEKGVAMAREAANRATDEKDKIRYLNYMRVMKRQIDKKNPEAK